MRTIKLIFLFGSIATIAWSCSDSVSPESANGFGKVPYANAKQVLPASASSSSTADSTIDFAKEIPGFGGMFINQSGQFTIYLTHPAKQKAKAREVLSSSNSLTEILSRYSKASVSNMVVKKGRYTFIQLYGWDHKASGNILAMDGVYSSGIDQSLNKLSYGVKNKAVKNRVIKKLPQLNIPKDAVMFYQMTKPEFYDSH
jgi:hypothetical protein